MQYLNCRDLFANPDDTGFHESLQPPVVRSVSLTNHLPFGIAVWKIVLAKAGRTAFSVGKVFRFTKMKHYRYLIDSRYDYWTGWWNCVETRCVRCSSCGTWKSNRITSRHFVESIPMCLHSMCPSSSSMAVYG